MATLRQKRVVAKILENGGNVSKAMRESGYSPETAKTPKTLTKGKGFQELMEKMLPDSLLLKKHREGLEATKYEVLNGGGEEGGWEKSEVPDYAVRHKYVQTGYDIKGKLGKQEGNTNNILVVNIMPESANRYGITT